jgi:DNA-binding NtrC family response regulator
MSVGRRRRGSSIVGCKRSVAVSDLESVERLEIERRLAECGGCKKQAAKVLGIHVRTLQRKLARWKFKDQYERKKR